MVVDDTWKRVKAMTKHLQRLGQAYEKQGKMEAATLTLEEAGSVLEYAYGPDHPEVAKDLVNLGNAFCDQNQHADAVPLYLRALAIDQAALGDDHPETLASCTDAVPWGVPGEGARVRGGEKWVHQGVSRQVSGG